jgi:peroxiredoxin
VDLQNDPEFQALNVAVVSIAFDSAQEQSAAVQELGSSDVAMLVDDEHTVSETYDVLQWAVRTGEPGHTFILVDASGKIVWIWDYGSPNLPDATMYVPAAELVTQIVVSLD